MTPVEFDETQLQAFNILANGNHELVEAALINSLKLKRRTWWKIWQQKFWTIDQEDVISYIKEHRINYFVDDPNLPKENESPLQGSLEAHPDDPMGI